MEFFALDDEVGRMEAELESATGHGRLAPLLALAWQMRQRDTRRALLLADQAQALLDRQDSQDSQERQDSQGSQDSQNLRDSQNLQDSQNPQGSQDWQDSQDRQEGEGSQGSQGSQASQGGGQGGWPTAPFPEREVQRARARLALVRGEAKCLFAELDAGQALADDALRQFGALSDPLGCADAHRLLAALRQERGDMAGMDAALDAMVVAVAGADPVRIDVAAAVQALQCALADVALARRRWGARFADGGAGLHPAAGCVAECFLAAAASQDNDFHGAVRHFIEADTLASSCGQIWVRVMAAVKIGANLNSLNEHREALDWTKSGLELARATGWPGMLGLALQEHAQTLRHLGRHQAARSMLGEALLLLAPLAASRNHAFALRSLGEAELECGDNGAALVTFGAMAERADALGQPELQSPARRGQAVALFRLGQPRAALAAAEAALSHGKGAPERQIAALRVMAEIHAAHPLPRPPSMSAASAPLHFLLQALALAHRIEGYLVPGELLDAVAEAYAAAGDYRQAFQYARQATAAREQGSSLAARNRASAQQVVHQAALERAEGEHHRQLAASEALRAESEARRAEALRQNGETLERLGAIGQEITAHLDARLVFETLNRHVQHMLDASCFVVRLLDPEGATLDRVFGIEGGKLLPPHSMPLFESDTDILRCVRERREILVNREPAPGNSKPPAAGRQTLSAMHAPLCVADTVLGGMTIQSFQPFAYGPREQLVLRSLCAYAAIALANCQAHGALEAAHRDLAAAHLRLKETQQQLVLQEKMAGLGTLTAGVAHEINNPTNFAHVGAQNLSVLLGDFRRFVDALVEADEHPETMAAFALHFDKMGQQVSTILNGTERIKGIVKDLRAFTRLDEAEKKPVRLSHCLDSTLNLVRTSWQEQVEFVTRFQHDPEYECWPALLNQVFMNLLVNACQACAAKRRAVGQGGQGGQGGQLGQAAAEAKGRVEVGMQVVGGSIKIVFADNGTGMPLAVLDRILEPFFTTKGVGQGTGLGLSISYGILKKHGGDLRIESESGHGSRFTVLLPLPSS